MINGTAEIGERADHAALQNTGQRGELREGQQQLRSAAPGAAASGPVLMTPKNGLAPIGRVPRPAN